VHTAVVDETALQVKQTVGQVRQAPLKRNFPVTQEVHFEDPVPLQVKQDEWHPTQFPEFAGLIVVPEPQAHTLFAKGYPGVTPHQDFVGTELSEANVMEMSLTAKDLTVERSLE